MSNIMNSDDDSEGKPTVWASEARPLLEGTSDAQCMSTAILNMMEFSVTVYYCMIDESASDWEWRQSLDNISMARANG